MDVSNASLFALVQTGIGKPHTFFTLLSIINIQESWKYRVIGLLL